MLHTGGTHFLLSVFLLSFTSASSPRFHSDRPHTSRILARCLLVRYTRNITNPDHKDSSVLPRFLSFYHLPAFRFSFFVLHMQSPSRQPIIQSSCPISFQPPSSPSPLRPFAPSANPRYSFRRRLCSCDGPIRIQFPESIDHLYLYLPSHSQLMIRFLCILRTT